MEGGREIIIRPRRGWVPLDLGDLWSSRELLFLLAWRDIKVKYKQTALGAAWAILQPLTAMAIFSAVFGRYAGVPSDGLPYPLFVYAGLLLWNYFAGAVANAGTSVVANAALVTKVFFPRILIPAGAALGGLVDLTIASLLLVGMMLRYGVAPSAAGLALLPFLVLLLFLAAVGCGLWLSALNVEYRDFQYVIPFLVQIGLFVTPVIYPASLLPERHRWLLALNPVSGIIEAFRAALFGHRPVPWPALGVSALMTALILLGGLLYFRRVERSFADVI